MADRFADLIEIAGVSFTGCRGILLDGFGFADPVKESVDWALDATPVNQLFNTQFRGLQFGVSIGEDNAANLISKVNNTIYAIRNSVQLNGWFTFEWIDKQYNIEARIIKDSSQQWFTYGKYSGDYLESIVFRFIIKEAIAITLSTEEEV